MRHRITGVDKDSIADELSIEPGSFLISINGEDIVDIVDYEQLCTAENLVVAIETPDGEIVEADIEKDMYEPLGINFADDLIGGVRSCKNRCIFCFIDQMARGGRKTLHVKDDDWRMSLIMGNYITLTNVDEREFERIIKRKASPLYISVHTMDGELRKLMMANPTAGLIGERLERLKEAGIRFHCQVVLCPDINDGERLEYTLEKLSALYPAAQSVAIVPVGLTKHRDGLYPLRCQTREEAREAIAQTEAWQRKMRGLHGTSFAYAADEMYIKAGLEIPPQELYEDYPQLENGVGLLRKLESEMNEALKYKKPLKRRLTLDAVTGESAKEFLGSAFARLKEYNIHVNVHGVRNSFLGESVTVAGLVTAGDIVDQLGGRLNGDAVIIPESMMRENDDIFLDGVRLGELEAALNKNVRALCPSDGDILIEELFAMAR